MDSGGYLLGFGESVSGVFAVDGRALELAVSLTRGERMCCVDREDCGDSGCNDAERLDGENWF